MSIWLSILVGDDGWGVNEVDFLPIAGAYHNLCAEELLPWTDTPWEDLGWKALAFFQRHLCQ